jgi:hypothetical protein
VSGKDAQGRHDPRHSGGCSGASDCRAAVHIHGCYADKGNCSEPSEHSTDAPNRHVCADYTVTSGDGTSYCSQCEDEARDTLADLPQSVAPASQSTPQ